MEKKSMKDEQPEQQAAETSNSTDASETHQPETSVSEQTSDTPASAKTDTDKDANSSKQEATAKPAKEEATQKADMMASAKTKPAKSEADASKPSTSSPDPVKPGSADKPPSDKNSVSKLAILALLLALISLGVIGYGYTLIQKMHVQQSEQVNALQQQLGDSDAFNRQLQQQNGQILGELNQMRSASSEQQRNVDELQNRLSKAMQQVSKLGTDSRKDWLLAEVEYLLRLANQRVLMERTAGGALSLLKGADQILKETDDVSIYPVRKALAQDIVALEAVPELDIDGMFLKLAAINGQVDNLRLLPITDKHQLPEMLKEITPETMSQSWQDGMADSWASAMDKLGNLIVIRHRDEPVTPLLSPEQHYFLTQNLYLMLEQTQLALLQGKQDAYNAGLEKSKAWIDTYFEASDATTQALLRGLAELQGVNIAPSLPDISGSLKQLKNLSGRAAQSRRSGLMKLLLIFALVVLLAGSIVGELIVQDPGYVLLSFKNTTIETSIWGLFLILVVSFTALYLTLQLLQYLLQRRRKIHQWNENRGREQANRKTLSGLNALSAGRWSKAQRLLSQAAPKSGISLVNYLAAARAAHEQNQHETCDELLDKARLAAPKAEVAIGIIQSQIQIDRGLWESALATLVRLRQKAPKHSLVLKLLTQTYSELKDWGSIVQLLPELRRYRVYPDEQLQQLEQQVYLGHLRKSLESVSPGADDEVRRRMLMHSWKAVPKTYQHDTGLILRQVELLLDCGANGQAESFLKERLKKQWHADLVKLYGCIEGADLEKQFKQALSWQQDHPNDAELQLTLGRLALRNSEWQQAQQHFEQSLQLKPSGEAYAELARLLNNSPDNPDGQQLLQQHVSSLTADLPELPQPSIEMLSDPEPPEEKNAATAS